MSWSVVYEKIPSEDINDEERLSQDPAYSRSKSKTSLKALCFLLLILASNFVTWFLSTHKTVNRSDRGAKEPPSPYAGLEREITIPMHGHDPYTDRNDTFRDQLWEDINIDDGIIALPDEYVHEKGLPEGQLFPWDHSKRVYLLQGYHNLHCTRAIYIALMEYRYNLPQTRNFRHVIHCLDALRRDTICNADDTPRTTTNDSIPETGYGQYRQCRSWDKLAAWARQYNACYRYINESESPEEFPQINRFVWCPKDSPYRKEVEKVYKVVESDSWSP